MIAEQSNVRRQCDSCDFVPQGPASETGEEAVEEGTSRINEQASFAVNKLRELNEKLEYKRQALNSIQNAPKPDKKVTLAFKVVFESFHFSDLMKQFSVYVAKHHDFPKKNFKL